MANSAISGKFSVILAHIDGVFSTYFHIKLTNLENQSVPTALWVFSTYDDIKTITRKTSRISNLSMANYNFSYENRYLEELAPDGCLLYSVSP